MTINDTPVGSIQEASIVGQLASANNADFDRLLNSAVPEINRYIDTELFNSDKEARLAIKKAVNDNTRSWQVFKRRHLRKDIQNMTGVGDWRLFATTRDRIDAKQASIQTAIMRKVLPNNRTGQLIGCVFGSNPCPDKSDPGSKESRPGSTGTTQVGDQLDSPQLDENGNPIPTLH